MSSELDAIVQILLAPPVSDLLENCDLLRLALVNRVYRTKTREALDVRLMYRRRIFWLMKCTGYGELFRKEEKRAAWTRTAPMGYMTYCKTTSFGGERMIKLHRSPGRTC